ncbi:MAG TPA: CHRD domain-containing protein [Pseudolabrys sp.]|nr:CHRD domain-containing protein [Pseudolabrys sp.]
MRSTFLRSALTGLACVSALAFALPASAEVVNLKATLSGKTEVPPNSSAGTGAVTAAYDTNSKKLTWKGTYSGLSGPATAAHFHGPAEAGKNAGVAIPISPNASPFEGSATLTDAQAADLLAGKWYVNLHTEANKAGELRGQLTK